MSLLTDLISYWKLDEASGVRADSHGSNDLADNNTVLAAAGIINDGADLEVSNSEYLSIADASQSGLLDGLSEVSFSLWVKPESLSADHFIISKGDVNAGTRDVCMCFFIGNTGYFELRASDDGTLNAGHNISRQTAAGVFTTGVLYHIALTFDVVNETVNLYVNGSLVGWSFSSGSMGAALRDSTDMFVIGMRENNGAPQSSFDGIIDEVGVWNRILTTDEVTELYNSGAGLAYPFTAGAVQNSNFLSLL